MAFVEAEKQAQRDDGPAAWADLPRSKLWGSPGLALPAGSGDPRGSKSQVMQRSSAYYDRDRAPEVRGWIAEAEAELAAGKPAFALALGRELHLADIDDYREESLRLMVEGYYALGRDALADIAIVHYTHRDLSHVSVLADAVYQGNTL